MPVVLILNDNRFWILTPPEVSIIMCPTERCVVVGYLGNATRRLHY